MKDLTFTLPEDPAARDRLLEHMVDAAVDMLDGNGSDFIVGLAKMRNLVRPLQDERRQFPRGA